MSLKKEKNCKTNDSKPVPERSERRDIQPNPISVPQASRLHVFVFCFLLTQNAGASIRNEKRQVGATRLDGAVPTPAVRGI